MVNSEKLVEIDIKILKVITNKKWGQERVVYVSDKGLIVGQILSFGSYNNIIMP